MSGIPVAGLTGMRHPIVLAVLAFGIGFGTSGCALLALPVLGSALTSGAGDVAKFGAERSLGGGAARTFSAPADDVHQTALSTLQRLNIKVLEEERARHGETTIHARAYERRVTMKLEPVTPTMTRLKLVVRHGLGKDRQTANEIVAQIEQDMEGPPVGRAARARRAGTTSWYY